MGVEGAGGGAVGVRGQRLGQQEAASGVAPVGVCHAYIRVFGGGYHEGPRGVIHAYARLWGPTSLPMAQGMMTSRGPDDVPRGSTSRHSRRAGFVRSLAILG